MVVFFFSFLFRKDKEYAKYVRTLLRKREKREGERKIKKNGMLLFHPIATFVVSLAERRHAIKLSVDET